MRLISYLTGTTGGPRIGVRVGHRVLDIEAASRVDGEPLPSTMKALLREGRGALSRVQALARKAQSDAGRFAAALCEERAIRFLPPVPDPDRFVCTREGIAPVTMAAAGLVGHGSKMAMPAAVQRLCCEPGLVFVIGRRAAGVKAGDDAMDYAVGVTLFNDFTGAGANGAASPVGPEIVTMDELADPYDLWLTYAVNGAERMRVSTGDLARGLPAILEQLSRTKAMEPGDMVSASGATAGNAGARELVLKPGDVVESGIEAITTLRTTLVES
jgi:acylpyruvate hydrolase